MAQEETQSYEGRNGVWLRSTSAESFVTAEPYPRILAFNELKGENWVYVADHQFIGLRTWFIEPGQPTAISFRPSGLPGRFIHRSETAATVEGAIEPGSKLQVLLDVRLATDKSQIIVRHGVRNASDRPRTLAIWSLVSLAPRGLIVSPWGEGDHPFRTLVLPTESSLEETSLLMGVRAFGLDTRRATRKGSVKFGVRTEPGWAAMVADGKALVLRTHFNRSADYPEGGANLTFYTSDRGELGAWSEMEQVGPLTAFGAGETKWLEESYEIVTFTSPPGEDVDSMEAAIRDKLSVRQPGHE